jgi:hypothetical protein
MEHRTTAELEQGLDDVRSSPADDGTLELIVRRPAVDEREVLDEGTLDLEEGLVGDSWKTRWDRRTEDGSAHPDKQLNIMNARVAALVAGDRERWSLAGDQLYVDFDLSDDNAPPGTRLAIGATVIEVTPLPHAGCKKFSARFGVDALKFVNAKANRALHMRGVNARIVTAGTVRVGDTVRKV